MAEVQGPVGIVVKHILKHPKTGRLSFRRAYPPELRPFIPHAAGKEAPREHKVSLGAADVNAPGVLARYEKALGDYEVTVALARRAEAGAYDRLDAPMIAYIAKRFEMDWHQEEEKSLATEGADWAEKRREGWWWLLDEYKEARISRDFQAMEGWWGGTARAFLADQGLILDPQDHASFQALCKALNDTVIGLSEASKARLAGNIVPVPPEPVPPSPAGRRAAPVSKVPILATFDAYAKDQGMTAGVRQEWRRAIERLIDFVGHDDAARLSAQDVMRWRDALLDEPSRRGGKRDPKTVKGKYISAVRAMLGWAVQEQKLQTNVAAAVVVRVPKKAKLRDRSFTTEEAMAILTATLTPASDRMASGHILARRWIPWLCAYTGARVNEFSQMRGKDLRQVEGIWTIRITPEAGTTKNKEARIVPLHPHLIEQGFLAAVKAQGDGPLFYDPGRQRVAGIETRHFRKVGERLAKWVREDVGITDEAIQPNHGWRHTFKTRALAAGMPERIADVIQGHAATSVGRTYGSVPLQTMAAAIAAMPRFEVSGL